MYTILLTVVHANNLPSVQVQNILEFSRINMKVGRPDTHTCTHARTHTRTHMHARTHYMGVLLGGGASHY